MSLQSIRKEQRDMDREKRFLAAHAACHDRIYRYFRRRTDNAATAEDLCAEAMQLEGIRPLMPLSLSGFE